MLFDRDCDVGNHETQVVGREPARLSHSDQQQLAHLHLSSFVQSLQVDRK